MKKYNMKMPKEKEKIVKRHLNGESAIKLADEYEIDRGRIYKLVKKYQDNGINGLNSNTGKHKVTSKDMGIHLRKPKNKI